jgi:hypothetical protein
MEPLVFRNARLKFALLLLISAGFTASGIFLLYVSPADRWKAWFVTLFFGSCTAVFVKQLFDARPRLIIDDDGIHDRTLGVGKIPWSEITGAYRRSISGNEFICLEVRNPEMWLQQLSPTKKSLANVNRALGFTQLNINLAGLPVDAAQVHELILKRIAN